jgi:hypothetical protein
MALIDAPILDCLHITFFHQLIFDTPQLTQFISRTLHFRSQDEEARVTFFNSAVVFTLREIFGRKLELGISCRQSDRQLSSLAESCQSGCLQEIPNSNLSFPWGLMSSLERLYACEGQHSQLRWQGDVENSQWLELLQPFTAVKKLYLSRGLAPLLRPPFRAFSWRSCIRRELSRRLLRSLLQCDNSPAILYPFLHWDREQDRR